MKQLKERNNMKGGSKEAALGTGAHGDRDKGDKLGTPWSEKIWLGKSEISDEPLCLQ